MKRFILLFALLLAVCLPALANQLELPEGLTEIEPYAFYGCTDLIGELVIPDTVKRIDEHAFDGCTGLTGTVVLPEGIEYVDETAFVNTAVTVMSHEEWENRLFFFLIEDGEATITGYAESAAHDLVIPPSIGGCPVTKIGPQAFSGMSGLTGPLTLPDTLIRIDQFAFAYCTGLTGDLLIPDSVQEIGDNAFDGCTGLDGTLHLPASIRVMGSQAFMGSVNLKGTITVPQSIESWDRNAFLATEVKVIIIFSITKLPTEKRRLPDSRAWRMLRRLFQPRSGDARL